MAAKSVFLLGVVLFAILLVLHDTAYARELTEVNGGPGLKDKKALAGAFTINGGGFIGGGGYNGGYGRIGYKGSFPPFGYGLGFPPFGYGGGFPPFGPIYGGGYGGLGYGVGGYGSPFNTGFGLRN